MNGTDITEEKQQSEVLDKDFFLECMRSVVKRMQKQEQMIQVLVDDLRMRNHEGVLYLRSCDIEMQGIFLISSCVTVPTIRSLT